MLIVTLWGTSVSVSVGGSDVHDIPKFDAGSAVPLETVAVVHSNLTTGLLVEFAGAVSINGVSDDCPANTGGGVVAATSVT